MFILLNPIFQKLTFIIQDYLLLLPKHFYSIILK